MSKVFISLSLLISSALIVISCGKAEDLVSPTHYTRVPRAVNLSISFDTTATGFYRVNLNWGVESTTNLKDFEIYRRINNEKFFFLIGGITNRNFIDSSLSNKTDSVKLAYFVNGRGIDRFVGQSSDTAFITVTKSF